MDHRAAAAAIEPVALLARDREVLRVHQRDLPLELDPPGVALLQLQPRRFDPHAPGWEDLDVIGDFHACRAQRGGAGASMDDVADAIQRRFWGIGTRMRRCEKGAHFYWRRSALTARDWAWCACGLRAEAQSRGVGAPRLQ